MTGIPSNVSELERIRVLREFNILDTPQEKEFDDLADLASAICDVPMSLITLIDSERQWFKAKKGMEGTEVAREISFCNHAIQQTEGVMVVPDSQLDDRFSDNPFVVNDPHLRFYAGAPLLANGNVPIGTLCILDKKPKNLSEDQKRMLKILAKRVMDLMELRKKNNEQKLELREVKGELSLTLNRLLEAQHVAKIGSWDWNLVTDELYWSPKMFKLFGLQESSDTMPFDKWKDRIHPDDIAKVEEVITTGLKENRMLPVEYRIGKEQNATWVSAMGKTVADETGRVIRIYGTVQDITNSKRAEIDKILYAKTLQDMLFDLSHKIRQPLTNCMALVQIFETHVLTEKEKQEYANYLNLSVEKMDEYLRESSSYVYRNKKRIS